MEIRQDVAILTKDKSGPRGCSDTKMTTMKEAKPCVIEGMDRIERRDVLLVIVGCAILACYHGEIKHSRRNCRHYNYSDKCKEGQVKHAKVD